MRHRTSLARAVTVIILVPVLLLSCSRGQAPAVDSPREVAETTELFARLYEQTWGDVADRQASDLLAYANTQGGYKKCVTDAGFSYTPPPFDESYLGFTRLGPPAWYRETVPTSIAEAQAHGFGLGERAKLLLDVAISRGRAPWVEPPNPGYTSLPPDKKPLYEVATGRCGPADMFGDGQAPLLSETLWRALHETVAEVVESPVVQDAGKGYPDCMAAAGFPIESRDQLVIDITKAYGELTNVPRPGDWRATASTPEWATVSERERRAAVADAQCRTEVYPLTMTLLRPKLEQFARDHAAEITQLATQWAEVRAKAAKVELPL